MKVLHFYFVFLGILTLQFPNCSNAFWIETGSYGTQMNGVETIPSCDCEYIARNTNRNAPGGCRITKAPPQGWKCSCIHHRPRFNVCSGEAIRCLATENCPGNCVSKECCVHGLNNDPGSDCNGYKGNNRTITRLGQGEQYTGYLSVPRNHLAATTPEKDKTDGGIIVLIKYNDAETQQWDFKFAEVDKVGSLLAVEIRNLYSDKCLEINGSNGNVDQWSCTGTQNQQWYILDQQDDKDFTYLLKNKQTGTCLEHGLNPIGGALLTHALCAPWNRKYQLWSTG